MKRAKPHPNSWEEWEGLHGTYPDGGRVFVKMNTTPILAGLAKEQIAPQLLWSRRLPDGNVMSAQEWLNGEILTPNGMSKTSGQYFNEIAPF